jgi:hypothetical protein
MDWRNDLPLITNLLPEKLREGFDLEDWAATIGDRPARNTLALLGLSTVLFYYLEREKNPKVNDIWDSLVYCSTCLSVGYGDIFAQSSPGKALGSLLMTVGPALTGSLLDGPDRDETGPSRVQRRTLETLEQILEELKRINVPATPPPPAAASNAE